MLQINKKNLTEALLSFSPSFCFISNSSNKFLPPLFKHSLSIATLFYWHEKQQALKLISFNHFFWESICDKDIFMAKQFHTVLFSNSNKCNDCEKLHPSKVANTVQTKHYHQKKPMGYLTK